MDEARTVGGLGCGIVHIHPEVAGSRVLEGVSESPSTVMQLVPTFMQQRGDAAWRRVQERALNSVTGAGRRESAWEGRAWCRGAVVEAAVVVVLVREMGGRGDWGG
jgi:hypothetical protein